MHGQVFAIMSCLRCTLSLHRYKKATKNVIINLSTCKSRCPTGYFYLTKQILYGQSRNVSPRWPGEYLVDFGEKLEAGIFLPSEDAPQPLGPYPRIAPLFPG